MHISLAGVSARGHLDLCQHQWASASKEVFLRFAKESTYHQRWMERAVHAFLLTIGLWLLAIVVDFLSTLLGKWGDPISDILYFSANCATAWMAWVVVLRRSKNSAHSSPDG